VAVKIDFTPIEEESIQFTPFGEVEEVVEEKAPTDIERIKDIAKQIPVSALKGAGGAYGNLLQALGVQDKELLPGEKIRTQTEFDVLEKLQEPGYKPTLAEIMQLTDDPIMAGLRGLPTSEDIGKGLEAVGIEAEAETPAGRIAGRGIESLAETAAFAPGSPLFMLASLLGGTGGQVIRELGGPEGLAKGFDIAASLTPAGKGLVKGVKALKKIPELTKRGITRLKGVKKIPTKIKPISRKKFIKTRQLLQKDIKTQINKMTEEKLPFSKLMKGDNEIWNRFENAFDIVRKEAATIDKTAPGGKNLFVEIAKSINKAKDVAAPSASTRAYVRELRTFRNRLSGKKLSATQWEKQYREINKGIRNLSKSIDISGGKEGTLDALNELRKLTAESIEINFKDHPEFVKSFKSLNKAYSDYKNNEAVIRLMQPAFSGKGLRGPRFTAIIDSKKGKQVLTRALGKDGYREMLDISKDIQPVNKLFEMLDVEKGNWLGLGRVVGAHVAKNVVGAVSEPAGKLVYPALYIGKGIKGIRKRLNNVLLSPAGRREWKAAVDAIKNQDKKRFLTAAAKLSTIMDKDPEKVEE